jgi:hypothetical protein
MIFSGRRPDAKELRWIGKERGWNGRAPPEKTLIKKVTEVTELRFCWGFCVLESDGSDAGGPGRVEREVRILSVTRCNKA